MKQLEKINLLGLPWARWSFGLEMLPNKDTYNDESKVYSSL